MQDTYDISSDRNNVMRLTLLTFCSTVNRIKCRNYYLSTIMFSEGRNIIVCFSTVRFHQKRVLFGIATRLLTYRWIHTIRLRSDQRFLDNFNEQCYLLTGCCSTWQCFRRIRLIQHVSHTIISIGFIHKKYMVNKYVLIITVLITFHQKNTLIV